MEKPIDTVHGLFIEHQRLAAAWVRYNSLSGKSSETRELRVMRNLSADDLRRMLTERGVKL